MSSSAAVTAVRGPLVWFRDDPFLHDRDESFVHIEDGLLICADGRITAAGPYSALRERLPAGTVPVHYPDQVIVPGFVDTHVHYVQTGIIAAFGSQLIDWLNHYTFVEEQRFSDAGYARRIASGFCDELLRNGTTTALTFCAVYPQSVDALFEEASRRNMRIAAGKVLMDRNAPDALLDTAETGYADSKALIARWHGTGRNLYAITPRFAPTSTPAQLEAAGALRREHPGVLTQTHVSENTGEISWVRSLFPERRGYLDVYDHYGLLGPRTVLAHGVHLTGRERDRCAETGTAVSHCPTSNLFLGSGLFHLHDAKDPRRPMLVGLGTDIGAGTSFSLLATMNEAYKVAELGNYPLDAVKSFYLATLGGAQAMGIADRVGSLEPGHEADFVVLDPRATPLLAERASRVGDIEELLFVLAVMGDDRTVRATYVAGALAHDRDAAPVPRGGAPDGSG
ncbi:guanine deaminase [Streptomyces clavuligerus]|uniref:Guanine deaminase n=1 Tax=Streptomyces clavuligerus TaxID=1901 RepID=E2Q197_STRCL|nr:guanine deaminase [Streptomyces clavuligerus]ANW18725.1 guanine deaminase [Streptomyces clavuligerus]AXU13291.1 guanine deaminase [Streptomyces clavuligerus]EFG08602.1 Guanine deaminase [Streptomyces clavuligerus]MBY6303243.1 guanine deaminase [Streptomyces clavuligerus]QCS06075.1 guanine deaminase [Streptomyces clavuligerus]